MKINNCRILFLFLLGSTACTKESRHDKVGIINANNCNQAQFVWLNDSLCDVYLFHHNKRLKNYKRWHKNTTIGQSVEFYLNGGINKITRKKYGKRQGVSYEFYPSGNLKSIKQFTDDSLRGYFLEYYDKFNHIKGEYFGGHNSKNGYIYERLYDSATQEIISVLDQRDLELEAHPNLTMEDLKLPWEKY